MAIPSWPASLPQRPFADGFSETPPNLLVRSATDIGPAKARRRATAGVTKLKAAFRLSPGQLATFRSFFDSDLQGGVLSFSWTHPVTGAVGAFRIVPPPSIEPVAAGMAWRISLDLELLP
ncbi:MAG: hypothetical protein IPK78_17585 [Rhodospirillales bacterium]|nr:hypothetical protein [Rhodospirillales bacterium]